MRAPRVLLALLVLAARVRGQTGSITLLESDGAFEEEVMRGTACWAILFISDKEAEQQVAEHVQTRFELVSATLADKLRFGIVGVHDAPKTGDEFLTAGTPTIMLFKHSERFGERVVFDQESQGVLHLIRALERGTQRCMHHLLSRPATRL